MVLNLKNGNSITSHNPFNQLESRNLFPLEVDNSNWKESKTPGSKCSNLMANLFTMFKTNKSWMFMVVKMQKVKEFNSTEDTEARTRDGDLSTSMKQSRHLRRE
jgi:hypothetical protein